jgi:hypothetical protein
VHNRRLSLAMLGAVLLAGGMQLGQTFNIVDRSPPPPAARKRRGDAGVGWRVPMKDRTHGRRAHAPKGTQSTRQKAARLRHDQRRRAR